MKRNLLILLLVLIAAGLIWLAQSRKKEKDFADKKIIFSCNESLAFSWSVDYLDRKGRHVQVTAFKTNGAYRLRFPDERSLGQYREVAMDEDSFIANVKNFNSLEYLSVVEDTTNHAAKWGVDFKNKYTLTFLDHRGRPQYFTLYRGNASTVPKGYYVANTHTKKIHSVEEWAVLALEKTPEELRIKRFMPTEPKHILAVRSSRGVDMMKIPTGWQVSGLNSNELDVREADFYVQSLGFLKAERVYDKDTSPFLPLEKTTDRSPSYVVVQVKYSLTNHKDEVVGVDAFKLLVAQHQIDAYRKKYYAILQDSPSANGTKASNNKSITSPRLEEFNPASLVFEISEISWGQLTNSSRAFIRKAQAPDVDSVDL